MAKFRYVRATPGILSSGRPVAFGDEVDSKGLGEEDEALKENGALIEIEAKSRRSPATSDKEGDEG